MSSIRRYTENYLARMLYLAPDFVIDAISNRVCFIDITKSGFVLRPNRKPIDPSYRAVKQWVDGYLATTPMGDPSAVGSLRKITIH